MAEKRVRNGTPASSSVSNTPKQPSKKARSVRRGSDVGNARRALAELFSSGQSQSQPSHIHRAWTDKELYSLVHFLSLKRLDDKWPYDRVTSHKPNLWHSAAEFIRSSATGTPLIRSAEACRNKALKFLKKSFTSPKDAQAYYFRRIEDESSLCGDEVVPDDPSSCILRLFSQLSEEERLLILDRLVLLVARAKKLLVPPDCISVSLKAMQNLSDGGRSNVVYNLAKSLSTPREDGTDTILPIKRMPMGLIEHCVNFFTSSSIAQIKCPPDYRQFLVTMFTLFGTKFVRIFSGPMWSVVPTAQIYGDSTTLAAQSLSPHEARVNVPGLSVRTLERCIAASGSYLDSRVQIGMLDSAVRANPSAIWWLKGDGVDIVSGLQESVRQQWNGDIDLDDGKLQRMYQSYMELVDLVESITTSPRQPTIILSRLSACLKFLFEDKEFIIKGLSSAELAYRDKTQEKAQSKSLFEAGWKVEELSALLSEVRQLIVDVQVLTDAFESDITMESYTPSQLNALRERLRCFLRDVYRQKRQPATHVFVFMISSEQRQVKPYAIPIQCVPYSTMDHATMRKLVGNVVRLMLDRGMKIAGFTSNGEYNSFRNRGYTRPLSVIQIKSDVKAKVSRLGKETMLGMLTPKIEQGFMTGSIKNPAIPIKLLEKVAVMLSNNLTWKDIVDALRAETVPPGYPIHTWRPGVEETDIEKLRAIIGQLEFSYVINMYDDQGVPFRTHLHVPEVHPLTGKIFCEREDPGHVLKRIAKCTRDGRYHQIKLEYFREALEDEHSNLTYSALVGLRKQSVEDATRLLSRSMAAFMENKGYHTEAKYISVIDGWRRAWDERGLSEIERSRLNYALFNFILDELIPWHNNNYDFSTLELTRDISNICGFTKQVLIALLADIETVEWRRIEIVNKSLPPESPRASTTDDVECFFSVLREQVGENFTLKQIRYEWRKCSIEFEKRIDPDLPYFYFTSHHDRFHEGERPDFSQPGSKKGDKLRRVPRRERLLFISGRATLPVRGSQHIRAKFHNKPLELPPPHSATICQTEHSYC